MDYNQLYVQFCDEFWTHFENSEHARGRKSATFQLWKDRSGVARKAMTTYLSVHGAPKDNPYYWMQHFPEPVPRNYNGANSMPDEPMVVALYNGAAGIYTRQQAEDFEMEIKRPFEL